MTKPKRKEGRPTLYTPELGELICERHRSGESLPEICGDLGMPALNTLYGWEHKYTEFSGHLDRARKGFALAKIDSLVETVEDRARDEMRDDQGRRDIVAVKRDELITGFYKWLAEKRLRKEYGNQVTQEITGADGAPLIPTITVIVEEPPSS